MDTLIVALEKIMYIYQDLAIREVSSISVDRYSC